MIERAGSALLKKSPSECLTISTPSTRSSPTKPRECWPGFHFFVDRRVGGLVRSRIQHDKGATGIRQNAKAAIAFSNRGYDARAVVQVVAISRVARTKSFGFVYAA